MPRLATFGYRMNIETSRKKSEVFRDCLEDAGVSLLLDIRYSPWGGYWNPKTIQAILAESSVSYLFQEDGYLWHKILGAPHKIRQIEPFSCFREAYLQEVLLADPEALERLYLLLEKEPLVAIMCCEEYKPSHDNCHRFALAEALVTKGFLQESDLLHLNMDDFA